MAQCTRRTVHDDHRSCAQACLCLHQRVESNQQHRLTHTNRGDQWGMRAARNHSKGCRAARDTPARFSISSFRGHRHLPHSARVSAARDVGNSLVPELRSAKASRPGAPRRQMVGHCHCLHVGQQLWGSQNTLRLRGEGGLQAGLPCLPHGLDERCLSPQM